MSNMGCENSPPLHIAIFCSLALKTLNAPVAEPKQWWLDVLQGSPACDNPLDSALKRDNLL